MRSNNSSIMRHRITLQERRLVENEDNETIESWLDVTTLHGSFEPLKGQEFFRSNDFPQKQAQVDARIRIRYRKGLNPAKHRIIYDGIVHDLVAAIPDKKHNQVQLMVKATAVLQADGGKVNE